MKKATKKMPKTFQGKSTKLGGGGRSAMIKSTVAAEYEQKGMNPKEAKKIGGAVAGMRGRAKYGPAKMAKMAAAGKKKANKKK